MNRNEKDKIISRKLVEADVMTEEQTKEVMKLPLPEEEACQKFDLSSVSTKELVAELRKRDGVDASETPITGEDEICVWKDYKNRAIRTHPSTTELRSLINDEIRRGHAIILRITD